MPADFRSIRPAPIAELWKTVSAELGNQSAIDLGIPKLRPEFLVSGQAYTCHQQDKTRCAVDLRVGAVRRQFRVSGDRYWLDGRATDAHHRAPHDQLDRTVGERRERRADREDAEGLAPAEPPAIPYDRARREWEEWAAAVIAVARLGVNADRAGKAPPPQWMAMLGEVGIARAKPFR